MNAPSPAAALEIVAAFAELGCAQMYDVCGGRAWPIDAGLCSRTPGLRLAGPVMCVGTNNDMLPGLQALDAADPGSVLYIQNHGPGNDALAGDIFVTACRQQRICGLVIEGAVRDIDQLVDIGVPVYSSSVTFVSAKTAVTPAREVPETLVVQGRELVPGSWLFGDGDGLLAVPAKDVSVVVKAGLLLHQREEQLRGEVADDDKRLGDLIGLQDFLAGRGDLSFAI